mmetsp:Transcript_16451/g.20334  ORF Transcript_16451/g.20334 Transcript_16451/m.20334 type:complete len:328 (-) Transcript_16451:616-1599(-)
MDWVDADLNDSYWYADQLTRKRLTLAFLFLFVILLLSLLVKGNNNDPYPWSFVSSFLGWSYFFAWSISFYPQLFLNHSRNSAKGLSTDFLFYNLLGFSCYSVYNVCFFSLASVQNSYKRRNNGKENLVTLNDVFFALHATTITLLTICQVFLLDYERERVSRLCIGLCSAAVFSIALSYVALEDLLDTLYWASYIKLMITTIKYCPQVYMNYKRQSTIGWSMGNVILDFTGGTLSILQLFIDSSSTHNWGGVIGNPVKFGLGFVSMLFDIIFMVQHFVLYKWKQPVDYHFSRVNRDLNDGTSLNAEQEQLVRPDSETHEESIFRETM